MLKDNLAKKISEKGDGFKRSVLSRKSGVTEATLYQILTGLIQNPGVYTVAKIADVLNCSVDELIDRSPSFAQSTNEKTELRPELFKNCVITVIDILHQKKKEASVEELIRTVKGLYAYCLDKNLETVDAEFANGFVEHALRSCN